VIGGAKSPQESSGREFYLDNQPSRHASKLIRTLKIMQKVPPEHRMGAMLGRGRGSMATPDGAAVVPLRGFLYRCHLENHFRASNYRRPRNLIKQMHPIHSRPVLLPTAVNSLVESSADRENGAFPAMRQFRKNAPPSL